MAGLLLWVVLIWAKLVMLSLAETPTSSISVKVSTLAIGHPGNRKNYMHRNIKMSIFVPYKYIVPYKCPYPKLLLSHAAVNAVIELYAFEESKQNI